MLVGVRVRVGGALLILSGCGEPQGGPPSRAVKDDPRVETKADAAPRRPDPTPADEARANPEPAPRQPLRFALGPREFTGVQAWATRFNEQRRIIVGSQATTCEELLAVPEKPKKGRVTLIVTVPWTTGTHAVTTAEIVDDDTRAVTVIEASDGVVELGDAVDGRRAATLTIKGTAGSASGTIDVAACD